MDAKPTCCPESLQEQREAPPEANSTDLARGQLWLPEIETQGRQLREISADALAALSVSNHPARIFQRGVLTRLDIEADQNSIHLTPLTGKVLRHALARAANWYRKGDPIAPPNVVVQDLEAAPAFPGFPVLEAVVSCPVAVPPGDLILTPGYHRKARLWYQADRELAPSVPRAPSEFQIREACNFIEDNLFVDFPFVGLSDRAVAWACLLLPFVRPMIAGPTPLHLLCAPTRGTGKTLLAHTLMSPSLGTRNLPVMTVDCEEVEIRKRITGCLRDSPGAVLLDNLGQGRRLHSSSLAAVLTARSWSDRLLGSSLMITLPVTPTWIATGNNPSLSDELVRRTLASRLDAGRTHPHLRTGFKHSDLLVWARTNRPALLEAILTLVQAWIVEGQPPGSVHLGMFEAWCHVVGGVLEIARVEGLQEAIRLYQGTPTDTIQAVTQFLYMWWERHRDERVGVKELYDVASCAGCLEELMDIHLPQRRKSLEPGDKSDRARQTRLGIALRRLLGQVYERFQIREAGIDRSGRQLYKLALVSDSCHQE